MSCEYIEIVFDEKEHVSSQGKYSPETRVVKIKRRDGKVAQGCDIYIGRSWNFGGWKLPKSKWHNPFTLKKNNNDMDKVLTLYEEHVRSNKELMNSLDELNGKILGCWCKEKPSDRCHGDVLVKLLKEKYSS